VTVKNSNVNGNQANGTVLGKGGGIYSFGRRRSRRFVHGRIF
jgi:hypothetical protein